MAGMIDDDDDDDDDAESFSSYWYANMRWRHPGRGALGWHCLPMTGGRQKRAYHQPKGWIFQFQLGRFWLKKNRSVSLTPTFSKRFTFKYHSSLPNSFFWLIPIIWCLICFPLRRCLLPASMTTKRGRALQTLQDALQDLSKEERRLGDEGW